MPAILRVTMTHSQPPDVSIRNWRKISKDAHLVQAQHWHKYYLNRHFLAGAKFRYGYRLRSRKYLSRKGRVQAAMGNPGTAQTDLLFTGATQRAAQFATFRAFPSRGVVSMQLPAYISINSKGSRPPLGSELTRVAPDELDVLNRILDREVQKGLDKAPRKPTRIA